MSLDQLLKDIKTEQDRLETAGFADTKRELCGNVYPMLTDLVEIVRDELAEVHEVVVEYFEGAESVIQADLAQLIISTLELGLRAIETKNDIDIEAFRIATKVLIPEIKQVCIDEEEEEEDEDDQKED